IGIIHRHVPAAGALGMVAAPGSQLSAVARTLLPMLVVITVVLALRRHIRFSRQPWLATSSSLRPSLTATWANLAQLTHSKAVLTFGVLLRAPLRALQLLPLALVNSIMGQARNDMRDTVVGLIRPQAARLDTHDSEIRQLQERAAAMEARQGALRSDMHAVQRLLAQ
ncbi:unnamed protein product, partial [Prorocentrum cordatum]